MENIEENSNVSDSQNSTEGSPYLEYELQILISLRRIIRAVDQYSRKLRTENNITGPQLICLLHIVNEQPHTISEISQSVCLSASTVVGIIDRLEEKGLVCRERSNLDRRQVKVTATEQGKAVAELAPSPLQDRFAKNLKKQTELEQATIALSLEKVVDMMEAKDIKAAPILESVNIIPSTEETKS